MSDQEIRSTETDENSRLANEDGERLIQMLSVIASNVDRAYPGATEDPAAGTTVVTAQGQHGFDQMSNLLTAITVPASVGQTTEVIPTIVHVDQSITMVQQEVVVGTPDLSLPDTDSAISLQPLHATDIQLDDVHALQQLSQKDQMEDVYIQQKKMVFMTNYRDYTICEMNGQISIGERKYIKSPEHGCKMVPVTDVSTGHKFEYQYRARGTVKRFEAKHMVIYFIGQISNERIRALYYQTVFQLVCQVGKIDLDKDYTSGRRVLSKYYSAFSPSKARTIRTPIEKLTYMKLLIAGDVEEDEDVDFIVNIDDIEGESVQASEKLRKSNAYKEKNQKRSGRKIVKISHIAEEQGIGHEQGGVEVQVIDGQTNDATRQVVYLPENVVKKPTRGRGRPPKKRPSPVWLNQKGPGTPKTTRVSDVDPRLSQHDKDSSLPLSDRGSSKRKIKRPTKLSDYYDFTKKSKKGPHLEGEEDEEEEEEDEDDGSDSIYKGPRGSDEPSSKKQKLQDVIPQDTVSVDQESMNDVVNEEVETSESASKAGLPAIDEEVRIISGSLTDNNETGEAEDVVEPDAGSEHEEASEPSPIETSDHRPGRPTEDRVPGKITTRIVEPPKKRGRGRPRKHPPREDDTRIDDDLVLQRKKYPSCQFQRAHTLKRYLCQVCLTNHENPIDEDGDPDLCPVLNARQSFKDQAATATGSSACSLMSLPTSLSVKVSPDTKKLTVCAGQDIAAYTEFGPLVGILLSEDDIQVDTDLSHVWFLQHDGEGEKFYLYTGDENASNWCHYLTPVAPSTHYNTVMVLRGEGIFFTTSQKIHAGSEIKVHIPYFGSKSRPVANMQQSECLHCKRSFQTSLNYQKHYHIFHPGGFTKQKQKCRLCNLSFPGMKDLQAHMDTKHEGQGAFQCDECPGTFPNPARLRIHKRDVHPPPEAAVSCDKCGKVYRSKRALANHNTNVHSEFKFACEVCGKWFDRRSTLLRHQRLHTGKYSHFCERCGKGFRDLHNLKVHTLTHSGVRPFSCTYCTNCSFSTRTCLKIHYERFHKMTEDMMPELARSIPFTMEAYSGTLPPVDKPAMRRNNKLLKAQHAANQRNAGSLAETDAVSQTHGAAFGDAGLVESDPTPASCILPGESLLQQNQHVDTVVTQKEVHLHIEDDSTMHIEQVVASAEEINMVDMPMVVEEVAAGTELVETEQVTEGDHCYYALNVDGQQVLVPATEEVCVIVENENFITLPSNT